MNERILKLVTQAREYAWENETHWSANAEREALFEQKFAELIVRDCRDMFVVGSVSWNLLNEKLEHFGVRE